MNIGFVCDWKKSKIRTWSGIPFSLLNAFSDIDGCRCLDIDVSVSRVELLLRAAVEARLMNGRFTSRFRFSPSYLRRLQLHLDNCLSDLKGIDAILEVGDLGVVPDVRYFVFQDLSIDLIIRYHNETGQRLPMFEAFSLDDLKRRREWQHKVYENSSGIFTMSQWLADSLINDSHISRSKVHVVGAGVNVLPRLGAENLRKRGRILFIGRDSFRKGGDLVVEAFKILRQSMVTDSTLVIAGPKRWPMKEKAPEGTDFIGAVDYTRLVLEYQQANVFCMPSRFEGFGIVFAEALCYGIPCIGRNEGVMKEVIQHGVNGYLIDHDDPPALAALLRDVLYDDTLHERVRAESSRYRLHYSWPRVARGMYAAMTA
jgi:glycosyltransferase involved in cell wall biosynthesis